MESLNDGTSNDVNSSSGYVVENENQSEPPVAVPGEDNENQPPIHKCIHCGRMYLNMAALSNHISKEHDTDQCDSSNEFKPSLYFVKIKNVWWPAQNDCVEKGEVIKVKLFNDERTELEVDTNNSKEAKPFIPLEKIPKNRSKEWKTCYQRALELFKVV